jgi:choline dehydrogenase-like flavoprotein
MGAGKGFRCSPSSLATYSTANIRNAKGGSSNMNFYCWIKPPAGDIDALERLGNPGWNWAEYEKYSKKSETYAIRNQSLPIYY